MCFSVEWGLKLRKYSMEEQENCLHVSSIVAMYRGDRWLMKAALSTRNLAGVLSAPSGR
jgi:hypothetical protein